MARFEKGRAKTGGRVKGSPVTNSLLLKDAALLACQLEGDIDLLGIDLKDKRQRKLLRERYKKLTEEAAERGGLLGYFRWIAREHPTAMMSFLGGCCRSKSRPMRRRPWNTVRSRKCNATSSG